MSADGVVPFANRRKRLKPFGLRRRVVLAFALSTLFISAVLSLVTFAITSNALVEQRESMSERQAFVNAKLVRSGLRIENPDISGLLSSLENPSDSVSILERAGQYYYSNDKVGELSLPVDLTKKVSSGQPAMQRFKSDGVMRYAVGIPMSAVDARYYEVFSLSQIESALKSISWLLVIASLIATVMGTLNGKYASGSVLRPLTRTALAAERIGSGDISTRLQPESDKDLDKLVRSFNRMADAQQSRIERDARFASDVAHELRSPLMTLMSGISVLQARRAELPDRSQTALDLLADEVERFQHMVQNLLEISRTDAGHADVSFEEVSALEFAQRVCENYEGSFPIEVDEEATDAVLLLDKRRIERVLGNLIENADRYAGGVCLLGVRNAGLFIRYVVDDNGPGIPDNEKELVFERFARGKSARARASGEGTGLGLSLATEHVRLHKGRIWVEDSPSGGARFVVELPKGELW